MACTALPELPWIPALSPGRQAGSHPGLRAGIHSSAGKAWFRAAARALRAVDACAVYRPARSAMGPGSSPGRRAGSHPDLRAGIHSSAGKAWFRAATRALRAVDACAVYRPAGSLRSCRIAPGDAVEPLGFEPLAGSVCTYEKTRAVALSGFIDGGGRGITRRFPAPRPAGSLRSCRIAPGDAVEPLGVRTPRRNGLCS